MVWITFSRLGEKSYGTRINTRLCQLLVDKIALLGTVAENVFEIHSVLIKIYICHFGNNFFKAGRKVVEPGASLKTRTNSRLRRLFVDKIAFVHHRKDFFRIQVALIKSTVFRGDGGGGGINLKAEKSHRTWRKAVQERLEPAPDYDNCQLIKLLPYIAEKFLWNPYCND